MRPAFAAVLAATLLLAAPAPTPATVNPARAQVVAKEFYYSLSRRSVHAGPAIIEIVNFGEDPHDMRLRRVGGTHTYKTPVVQPGLYYDLEVKLLPGRYELWCSIADHRKRGMAATLTVHA